MAVDARSVANEVLKRAWILGFEPTQIDIQKICYFLHGHHLRDYGAPMIRTEFEAYQYGPIQSSLLDAFKKWGDEPIGEPAKQFDPVRRIHKDIPAIEENSIMTTIDQYLEQYLSIPSFVLVDLTHASGTPWSRTMEAGRSSVNIGMRIDNGIISSFFEGKQFA